MTLERLIDELSHIEGYIAAAIIHANGNILFADAALSESDIATMAGSLHAIFHANPLKGENEVSEGVQKRRVTVSNSLNLVACLGVHAPVHLHFIVMMEHDGNQELMKEALEKVIDKTLEPLA